MSQVTRIALWSYSLDVFVFVIVIVFVFVIVFVIVFFRGQVMSPHRSDQMSQRSQVSRIALGRCSLNVFVIGIVIVIVFVFVIVFFQVRSCLFITLIKCLKGLKSLGSLCSVMETLIVSGVRPTKGQGHLLSCRGTAKKVANSRHFKHNTCGYDHHYEYDYSHEQCLLKGMPSLKDSLKHI